MEQIIGSEVDDLLAVAPLSEKDGEVFSLDFNAHKHHFCKKPLVEIRPPEGIPQVLRVKDFDMDGTYALLNVLSEEECKQIIALTERLGYKQTCVAGIAAQDQSLRGPDKVVWCADQRLVDSIFERCRPFLPPHVLDGRPLKAISPRFRCLRYRVGQHQLGPHKDRGLYPLSQVDEDGELRYDVAQDGSLSFMSFLIYLNEDFEGGETFFYAEPEKPEVDDEAPSEPDRPNKFVAGDIVSAVWSGDDDWYEATITAVHIDEDGDVTYDVRFNDDYQEESGLHASIVKSVDGDDADTDNATANPTLKTVLTQAEVDAMRKCHFKPRTGACVVFYSAEEGLFDKSPIHEGGVVRGGSTRYVIRTDVIFGPPVRKDQETQNATE